MKCYSLWTKWVLKFLSFGSDDTNHFENASKFLNKSWWYLLKHVCFYNKTQGFLWYLCTFSMEENKRLSTRSGYCQRCACMVCMTSTISWPNCVLAIARIVYSFTEHIAFHSVISSTSNFMQNTMLPWSNSLDEIYEMYRLLILPLKTYICNNWVCGTETDISLMIPDFILLLSGPTGKRTIWKLNGCLGPAVDPIPCSLALWTCSIRIQQDGAWKGIGGSHHWNASLRAADSLMTIVSL